MSPANKLENEARAWRQLVALLERDGEVHLIARIEQPVYVHTSAHRRHSQRGGDTDARAQDAIAILHAER